MILTRFSFLTAFLWSSLFIILLYKCRKERELLELTGITPLLILTCGTLFRCFVPIDIPNFTKVFEFDGIFTIVNSILYTPWGNTPFNLIFVLFAIWGGGCIYTLSKFLYDYIKFRKRIRRFEYTQCGPLYDCASAASKELHTVMPYVLETDCVYSPTILGFFRPTILFPSLNLSIEDYRYVFLHEMMHWKERDTHIKLITKLFCCIFWWNPCCRYLTRGLHDIIEFRCDQSLAARLSEKERGEYSCALARAATSASTKEYDLFCVSEFSDTQNQIEERVDLMLKVARRKKKQKLISGLIIIGFILLLIFSYSFVIQSHYNVDESEISSNGFEEVSTENSYLVLEPNGEYSLYIDNEKICSIPSDVAEQMESDGFILKNSP